MSHSGQSGELVLVKLGGSLITDKAGHRAPREAVVRRLAGELAAGRAASGRSLVVGHGSGSYGHPAAKRHGLEQGVEDPSQLAGVGHTQRQAAELHGIVVRALADAGLLPFSLAPSSFVVSDGGYPVEVFVEPLWRALEAGMTPVVYGDVVIDRRLGASICSTERVLGALLEPLALLGRPVWRAIWAGDTVGVLGASGATLASIHPDEWEQIAATVGGAQATDVTGGMLHRVETAIEMARRGVESSILDGTSAGALEAALTGGAVRGTVVERAR